MNTPKVLLGYSRPSFATAPLIELGALPEYRDSIYMTLVISLEPAVRLSYFSTAKLECTELEIVKVLEKHYLTRYKLSLFISVSNPTMV